MALPQNRHARLSECVTSFDRMIEKGASLGCPLRVWSGPTSGLGPTSDRRWDRKYSNEINVGPTGPTWSANFLSLYMDICVPLGSSLYMNVREKGGTR